MHLLEQFLQLVVVQLQRLEFRLGVVEHLQAPFVWLGVELQVLGHCQGLGLFHG